MKQADLLWKNGRLHLFSMLSSRRRIWLLAILLGQIAALAGIGLLALSGWFLTAAGLTGLISLSTAYTFNYFTPAGIIRLLAIIRTAGRYGERLVSHNAVLGLLADLRGSMFARLAQIESQKTASIKQMHRLVSDIDLLNAWPLNVVLPALWAIIALILITLWSFYAGGLILAMIVLLPLLCAGVIIPILGNKYGCHLAILQAQQYEQRREALLQPLAALTALLQWQQWPRFANRFHVQDQHYVSSQIQQQKIAGRVMLLQHLFLALAATLVLGYGSQLLLLNQLTAAMLLAILLMIFGFAELVLLLGSNMISYGLCHAACLRLNELIETHAKSALIQVALPQQIHIQAKNLCARWPEALNGAEDINFELNNGDILFISGPSGIGKSTLLSVLANELSPSSGYLKCNNQPYAKWQWQGQVAYLSQQLDIFDLTLAENLRLGKADATDDELWAVLDQVQLGQWAGAQPQKLNTLLGEYGSGISGGQARRVALARFLLRPYALMILDEPFAGIDEPTCAHIAQMLENQQQQGILIVASHQHNYWPQAKKLSLNLI
ncbi:MAG: ATP-binding cassette domain-containing protein [Snodgrassella sp.]|nr:ATP-binding cassette domain-containing protein [Snodgrassella sp.]